MRIVSNIFILIFASIFSGCFSPNYNINEHLLSNNLKTTSYFTKTCNEDILNKLNYDLRKLYFFSEGLGKNKNFTNKMLNIEKMIENAKKSTNQISCNFNLELINSEINILHKEIKSKKI